MCEAAGHVASGTPRDRASLLLFPFDLISNGSSSLFMMGLSSSARPSWSCLTHPRVSSWMTLKQDESTMKINYASQIEVPCTGTSAGKGEVMANPSCLGSLC